MKRKGPIALILAVLSVALLVGCGSSGYSTATADSAARASYDDGLYANSYVADYDYAEEEVAYEETASAGTPVERVDESAAQSKRKLIRTVSMEAETEDYDALLSALERKVEEAGGYIESSNVYNNGSSDRSASLTLRIPSDKLDAFLDTVAEQSNVTYKSENVEDVTLSYVDLESHKKALLEEQERLLSFMEDAETIEELITIEDRLTEIHYQLESMESQLRTYDNQIDYSTVTLNIVEVTRFTPVEEESAWMRIRRGFSERTEAVLTGLKDFGIGLIVHIPDILVLLLVIVLTLVIVRLCLRVSERKRQRKNERKVAEPREEQHGK